MKSVTTLAKSNALTVLKNIDYYDNYFKIHDNMKRRIKSKLKKTITPSSFIYRFIMNDGPYLILFSKDNKLVDDTFKKHKIVVRYKPDHIRISITIEEAVEKVLNIISFLNVKTLIQCNKVLFDLDETLRIMGGPLQCEERSFGINLSGNLQSGEERRALLGGNLWDSM